MKNLGLVCEGGGLRGMYTTGILDFFLDMGLEFPYLVGVSAGAIYPASFVSGQRERSLNIQRRYINDPRYMSFRNLIKTGNLFDPDFAYFRMTKEFIPFDYDNFKSSKTEFKVGTFNCLTGKTDFHSKEDFSCVDDAVTALLASGSLPFLSRTVTIGGTPYLDGGMVSPIPIDKSIEDGNKKHIVILTQGKDYKKKPFKYKKLSKFFYRSYPLVADALINRHTLYNSTLEKLNQMEKEGNVFIFRPSVSLEVNRLEKDVSKIEALYSLGYEDAKREYSRLLQWLSL